MLKVDLFVAGGTPLDAQQLARRQRVTLSDGRDLHVHPPEDILLQKLRWFRLGGEVSDRQWRDVLAIVRVQGDRLDRVYLRQNAPALAVADLLELALEAWNHSFHCLRRIRLSAQVLAVLLVSVVLVLWRPIVGAQATLPEA